MVKVFKGTLDECIEYIKKKEKKDKTLIYDIYLSKTSHTLYYVYEVDKYATYHSST